LNVDLIAGLAGQTFASWEESLMVMAALADTGVPHASVYMLEVDQDSRLGREVLSAGNRYHADLVPSDDTIARMYERSIEMLGQAGLEQYEISNFCRTGKESHHNLRYWQRRPYLGLGLDASSMLTASEDHRILRSTTTDDLTAYLAGSEPVETTWLTPAQQHEEAWFLGLRLNAGVDIVAVQREFGAEMVSPALNVVARLVESGLLVFDGKTVRLTAQGRLLSNDVFQEFLGLELNQS
jgi:oxygen-independent coproporphyrinogen-3 oxidase